MYQEVGIMKMCTSKFNGKIEGGLSSKRYNIPAKFVLMVFLKGILKFLDVFRHSVIKSHNTCTTQLVSCVVFECLFPSYCLASS